MTLIDRTITPPPSWPPPRDRAGVTALLQFAQRRDRIGDRVHFAFGLLYLFTLPLSTAGSAITFAVLLGYALLRAPHTWRCYTPLPRMPVLALLLVWTAWSAVSIAWSKDPAQGWDELRAARVILTPLLLWPTLDRLPRLIVAALVGVAAQNLVQGLEALRLFGFAPGQEGRLDGSLHAIQTGGWCAAAMCWHLGAVLLGRGALRWLSLAGFVAAAAGLVATGSRGPWIAAGLAVPLMLLVTAVRRPAARRSAVVLLLLGLVGSAAAWPVAGRMIQPRVERAFTEVRDAREHGIYWTSAGLRLGLWEWAWSIYLDAPIAGAGAGSYQSELWAREEYRTLVESAAGDPDRVNFLTREHAHSTYLQVMAGTGTIGGAVLLTLLGFVVWRCARDPADHIYVDGSLFVLVSWLIGAQFDCYHLNGHLFGMFALVLTATLAPRPEPYPSRVLNLRSCQTDSPRRAAEGRGERKE